MGHVLLQHADYLYCSFSSWSCIWGHSIWHSCHALSSVSYNVCTEKHCNTTLAALDKCVAMAPPALLTTAIAFGIAVCTAQNNYCEKSNLLVLTTASQLRKEVRKEVNEALTETLPQLCTSDSQNQTISQTPSPTNNCTCEDIILAIETLEDYIKDEVKAAVNNTVSEVLTPLLSHLLTPGCIYSQSPCHLL